MSYMMCQLRVAGAVAARMYGAVTYCGCSSCRRGRQQQQHQQHQQRQKQQQGFSENNTSSSYCIQAKCIWARLWKLNQHYCLYCTSFCPAIVLMFQPPCCLMEMHRKVLASFLLLLLLLLITVTSDT